MSILVEEQLQNFSIEKDLHQRLDIVGICHTLNFTTLLVDRLGSIELVVELFGFQVGDAELQQVPALSESPVLWHHETSENFTKSVIDVVVCEIFLGTLLLDLSVDSVC